MAQGHGTETQHEDRAGGRGMGTGHGDPAQGHGMGIQYRGMAWGHSTGRCRGDTAQGHKWGHGRGTVALPRAAQAAPGSLRTAAPPETLRAPWVGSGAPPPPGSGDPTALTFFQS